jgi:multidrug efflux system membrane fusion protein
MIHRWLLLCLCCFALSACSGQDGPGARKIGAAPVAVAEVTAQTVPYTVRAVGTVEPLAEVEIKSQVEGTIVRQYVRDGQEVKQGAPLFLIDPRPYELAVQEAEARLARDRVHLNKAEADLRRYSQLKKQNVVAQEQYDETFAEAKALESTIALGESLLAAAKLDREHADIRSPLDGYVGLVQVNQGNVVKANDDRSLCVIHQMEPIYVTFSVPQKHLPDILERRRKGPLTVLATATGSRKTVAGNLTAVDNAVDVATGAIRLRAAYANADRALWPGQFVRVDLLLDTIPNATLAPSRAIMDGLHGPYVYVVNRNNTASVRRLQTGPAVGNSTVVLSGLELGDKVVVDGQIRLAPGSPVEIVSGPEGERRS